MDRLTIAGGIILTAVEVMNIMIVVKAMDIMTADTTDIMTPAEATDMEATDTMMVEAADTEADTPVS
jgi:hypothetical protein